MPAALAHGRLGEHAAQLRHALEQERARHDRVTWEVVGEDVVGEADALDGRGALGRLEALDTINQIIAHPRQSSIEQRGYCKRKRDRRQKAHRPAKGLDYRSVTGPSCRLMECTFRAPTPG